MLKSRRIAALLVVIVLAAGSALIGSRATARSETTLNIAAQPSSGAAGTTVTITGQGADPNAFIMISGGYRQYRNGCPVAVRNGSVQAAIFAQTTADASGTFTATFPVLPNGEYSQAYFTAFSSATANGQSTLICFDIVGQAHSSPETGLTVHRNFPALWGNQGAAR
jgi:hypothetical protein